MIFALSENMDSILQIRQIRWFSELPIIVMRGESSVNYRHGRPTNYLLDGLFCTTIPSVRAVNTNRRLMIKNRSARRLRHPPLKRGLPYAAVLYLGLSRNGIICLPFRRMMSYSVRHPAESPECPKPDRHIPTIRVVQGREKPQAATPRESPNA